MDSRRHELALGIILKDETYAINLHDTDFVLSYFTVSIIVSAILGVIALLSYFKRSTAVITRVRAMIKKTESKLNSMANR